MLQLLRCSQWYYLEAAIIIDAAGIEAACKCKNVRSGIFEGISHARSQDEREGSEERSVVGEYP